MATKVRNADMTLESKVKFKYTFTLNAIIARNALVFTEGVHIWLNYYLRCVNGNKDLGC